MTQISSDTLTAYAKPLNPYIVGPPITEPELFFGRESLFAFIEDNLKQNAKVILLHGQRRIGKSSVLCQIPNFVSPDEFVFVLFDLQSQSKLPLGRVLHNMAKKIVEKLRLPPDRIALPSITELEETPEIFDSRFLLEVYQALNSKKLVLLLDEFDVLSNYNPESAVAHFFPYIQSIIEEYEQLFIIPVVGRRLDDLKNLLSLFRAPNREIGLLKDRNARRLITEPAKDSLVYESEAIEAILELSSGHPYFTQVICHVIFAQARSEGNWTVTREAVETIVDDAIEIASGGLPYFWEGLPIPERVVFSAVAEAKKIAARNENLVVREPLTILFEYGVLETDALIKALERLVEWNFIDEVESSELYPAKVPRYKVTVELVRRWLVKRYSLRREIRELENFSSEANQIYELASQLRQNPARRRNALNLYEEVLAVNPNHFKALFEMAEGYLEVEDLEKAVELYERAYLVDPILGQEGLVESRLSYGQKLMLQEKLDLAMEQFAKAQEIEPDNVLVNNLIEEVTAILHKRYKNLQNPFFINQPVPPEHFVGRKSEIAVAFDQISNHNHLAIWGGPGMGKSSFLNLLASPEVWRSQGLDPSKAVIVYLNCLSITPFMPSIFWREVLILVKDKLEGDAASKIDRLQEKAEVTDDYARQAVDGYFVSQIDRLLEKAEVTKDDLRQVLRNIGKQNKFLVLLLDDYDATLQTNAQYTEADVEIFLHQCRSLAYHSDVRRFLSTIVTSKRRLNEIGPHIRPDRSPWYNHYLFLLLKPFTDNEVASFFNSIPIVPTMRKVIQEIVGGHPTLIQNAGHLLYRHLIYEQLPNAETFIREFLVENQHIFQSTWQLLNEVEQILLMLIALSHLNGRLSDRRYNLGDLGIIFSQKERELTDLEQRGVIKRSIDSGKTIYSLASSIMEWWVIKEIENSNEQAIQERQKMFLDLMSRKQAERVITVIRYLWEHRDDVLSIPELIGNLITALPYVQWNDNKRLL